MADRPQPPMRLWIVLLVLLWIAHVAADTVDFDAVPRPDDSRAREDAGLARSAPWFERARRGYFEFEPAPADAEPWPGAARAAAMPDGVLFRSRLPDPLAVPRALFEVGEGVAFRGAGASDDPLGEPGPLWLYGRGPALYPAAPQRPGGVAAVAAVPEPASQALLLVGLAVLGAAVRHRRGRRTI